MAELFTTTFIPCPQIDFVTSLLVRLLGSLGGGQSLVSYRYEVDLERGLLHYSQSLPLDWDSLAEGPKIRHLLSGDGCSNGGQSADSDSSSFDYVRFNHDVMELIDAVDAALNSRNLMPPFSAHGLLTSGSTVRTFDGRFFSFSGRCDHLVTSDFLHGRVSVVGHYSGGSRTGLTVNSDGREIHLDTVRGKVEPV